MKLLDTHVLVWLTEGNPRLGSDSLQTINSALKSGKLGVPAICFWEIAMLVAKQRLTLQMDLNVWRFELLQTGLLEIPLQGSTAIRAGQLISFHGDPADRMIVSTAIENSATLITGDENILAWGQLLQKIDARL
jgi:PIN domain nuclease of toxin-antitoxin system